MFIYIYIYILAHTIKNVKKIIEEYLHFDFLSKKHLQLKKKLYLHS